MSGNAKKIEEKFKNFTKNSKPGELLVVSKNNEGIQHIHTFTVTNTTNGTVSSSGAPTGKETAAMARARGAETLRLREIAAPSPPPTGGRGGRKSRKTRKSRKVSKKRKGKKSYKKH